MVEFCTKCGHKTIEGASFCGKCGSRIIEEKQYPSTDFCSHCGTRREENRKFCMNCFEMLPETETKVTASSNAKPKNDTKEIKTSIDKHVNKPVSNLNKFVKDKKTEMPLVNIFANIGFAIFLLIMQSYIIKYAEIGVNSNTGGLFFYLVLLVAAYILIAFLHKKRKSLSLWVPSIIALFSIKPIFDQLNDFITWKSYQSNSLQSAVSTDIEGMLLLYLILLFLIPFVNLIISVQENTVK